MAPETTAAVNAVAPHAAIASLRATLARAATACRRIVHSPADPDRLNWRRSRTTASAGSGGRRTSNRWRSPWPDCHERILLPFFPWRYRADEGLPVRV